MNEVVARLPEPVHRLLRLASWHRRWFAAGFAGLAVAAALTALAPAGPHVVHVVAAARDIPPGTVLSDDDVAVVGLLPGTVPTGALRDPVSATGRVVAAPLRRGEPLTDVRLVGPSLLGTLEGGLVATPVRIADAGAVRLLRAGDVVDVLAASTDRSGVAAARAVASDVRVLAVPSPDDSAFDDGALVVLATTSGTAALLARAGVTSRLSVTIRR